MYKQIAASAMLAIVSALASAMGQDFPAHPVHIIAPYPPGGTSDLLARLVVPRLQAALGQPVIVDNKAGASGNIGNEFVAKAKPDGYTLLLANNTGMVINQNLYKLNFNPAQDLTPVVLMALVPTVLYVRPSVPADNLAEFIELAKKSPNKYAFASAGSGSPQHLAGEMLKILQGLDMVHVPYKGSGPALNDVVSGQMPVGFESTIVLTPFVEAKRVKALATTGAVRSIVMPNIPTMMESGMPEFNMTNWYGLFAPAGTPKAIVDRLNSEVQKIMASPETREYLAKLGSAVQPASAEDFAQFVKTELPRWADVVKKSHAKVD